MSVLDVKVKSGESPKFYKSGISSLEKRINQLEHQVFCCIPEELAEEHSHSQVILFALTANDAGTGTWQTITPATGIAVIPAPGAGKVTVIDRVVLELTCTVDITATSTIDPSITLYQTGGGTAVTDIIDLSGVTAAVTNEIAVAAPTGGALADYVENTSIILDVDAAVATLGAGETATGNVKIFYKTVSF